MIYPWLALVLWILVVAVYASWQSKPQFQVFVVDQRDAQGILYSLAFEASREFCAHVKPLRPTTLLGTPKPFPNSSARGIAIYEDIGNRDGDCDLSSADVMAGDPDEKMKAAARKLGLEFVQRVGCIPKRFARPALPAGLEFAAIFHDPETGVWFRVLRAYNVQNNAWDTRMGVQIEL